MVARTYTTVQGDTWDAVAYRLWGDEFLMAELLQANPGHADVLVFPAGVLLTVPDVQPRADEKELPVWMK